jgi:hypothetical protein
VAICEKGKKMSEGSRAKEIVLGDELGDIAVKANGVRVEIHTDGSIVAYTKSDVDAYTNGAVHVHPAANDDAKAAAKAEPQIGDRMADGTVFAGISPDTNKPMYVTPKDAPLTYTFNEAQKYAAGLNKQKAHDHDDWRVPTKGELNVLFNNRTAIGGFDVSGSYPAVWYWSSSQNGIYDAWAQRFSGGDQDLSFKHYDSSLRCVR